MQEQHKERRVKLVHIPTDDQVADIFTKNTGAVIFNRLSPRLMGHQPIYSGGVRAALQAMLRTEASRVVRVNAMRHNFEANEMKASEANREAVAERCPAFRIFPELWEMAAQQLDTQERLAHLRWHEEREIITMHAYRALRRHEEYHQRLARLQLEDIPPDVPEQPEGPPPNYEPAVNEAPSVDAPLYPRLDMFAVRGDAGSGSGKRYHQLNCCALLISTSPPRYYENVRGITLQDALAEGYSPCLRCMD
jgi:hypothetical protein